MVSSQESISFGVLSWARSLPYSTSRTTFSYANVKAAGSKLASVKYRGIGAGEMQIWKQEKQSCNLIKCSPTIGALRIISQKQMNTIILPLIDKVLNALICNFNKYGQFETEMEKKYCIIKYAKYGYIIYKKPWCNVDTLKIERPLTRGKLYYGGMQWILCGRGIVCWDFQFRSSLG